MLKVRLQRVGRKHDPSYRVIVTESTRGPKSGNHIEILGSYDSRKDKDTTQIKGERVKYWLSHGAQVSPTVHNILIAQKIIDGKKINVLPKKSPIIKEKEAEKEVPAEVPANEEALSDTVAEIAKKEAKKASEDAEEEKKPAQ